MSNLESTRFEPGDVLDERCIEIPVAHLKGIANFFDVQASSIFIWLEPKRRIDESRPALFTKEAADRLHNEMISAGFREASHGAIGDAFHRYYSFKDYRIRFRVEWTQSKEDEIAELEKRLAELKGESQV